MKELNLNYSDFLKKAKAVRLLFIAVLFLFPFFIVLFGAFFGIGNMDIGFFIYCVLVGVSFLRFWGTKCPKCSEYFFQNKKWPPAYFTKKCCGCGLEIK